MSFVPITFCSRTSLSEATTKFSESKLALKHERFPCIIILLQREHFHVKFDEPTHHDLTVDCITEMH